MTDNEIIKALECCNGWDGRCLNCPLNREGTNCKEKLNSYALDLINRQKAEVERLNIELQSMRSAANSYKMHYETAKSEAVKDFVEKFKRKATIVHKTHSGKHWYEIDDDEIDNIFKEMTEVEK